MSYCVNCGVELADSEKSCPLCGTEVINPRKPWKEPEDPPYPHRLEPVLRRADRVFFASIASLLLCVPVAVTLLSDLFSDGELTWSGLVAGAAALLFVWFLLPLYCKRYYLLRLLTLDCAAALAYLKLIEYSVRGSWFLPVAMPITVGVSILFLLCALVLRNHRRISGGVRAACVQLALGLATVWINMVVSHAVSGSWAPSWSIYAFLPLAALAAVSILLSCHKRFQEELHRRLLY